MEWVVATYICHVYFFYPAISVYARETVLTFLVYFSGNLTTDGKVTSVFEKQVCARECVYVCVCMRVRLCLCVCMCVCVYVCVYI